MSTTPMGMRQTKHIFVGETRIATKNNWWQDTGTEYEKYNTYWYHADHLGSAQLVSNWKGEEYERIEYTPYGETWIEKTSNIGAEFLPYKFTAQEKDEETGLYYYGARYLDPKYSRWLSTDPALGDYIPAAGKGNSKDAGNLPGMGGVYNHINFHLYHYAGNNPVKFVDPTGMWIDNEDGTSTAQAGDTLWDKYGADWKEKSGFDRDPRTLQVGETVGKINSSSSNNTTVLTTSSYYFSRWSYVPVEGIGANGGASFTGSTFLSDKSLSIFASGFFVAQNLVDAYVFFGDATLFVDGNKVGKSYFQSPNYPFISNGPPFITIGDANFDYDFTDAQSVEVDLHFRAGISVDSGINKSFINYSKYRMRIK